MTTPLDDLKTAVQAAAGELRNGAAAQRPAEPRAAEEGRLRRLLDERGDAARAHRSASRRARSPSGSAPRCRTRLGDGVEQRRGRRPRLPQPVPVRRLVPRGASTACSPPATRYGARRAGGRERVQVEFVSANPTGPLTAASGRHAAFGDALARILELAGNDGRARVLLQRRRRPDPAARRVDPGPRARRGAARGRLPGRVRRRRSPRRSRTRADETPTELAAAGVELMMAGIRATLERYRVHFDRWFSRALAATRASRAPGERAREQLARATGHAYRSEGALWLRTTALAGDEKDRLLVRSTGEPTYLAADVAYHWDKLERGFDRLVNVLGADHHGYVVRLKAALAARRRRPDRLDVPLLQFVHVVEGGERASMSKRARRLRHARRADRRDRRRRDALLHALALARLDRRPRPRARDASSRPRTPSTTSSTRTPGSRRCCARRARSAWPPRSPRRARGWRSSRRSASWSRSCSRSRPRSPRRRSGARRTGSPTYALETAQAFTAFYRDCRVVGAEPEGLESFRIALSVATQRVIARSLDLLGVSAPARCRRSGLAVATRGRSRRRTDGSGAGVTRGRRRDSGPASRAPAGPRC